MPRLASGVGAGNRRYCARGVDLYFRADAAFGKPEIYEVLEAEDVCYAFRLSANQMLQRWIGTC